MGLGEIREGVRSGEGSEELERSVENEEPIENVDNSEGIEDKDVSEENADAPDETDDADDPEGADDADDPEEIDDADDPEEMDDADEPEKIDDADFAEDAEQIDDGKSLKDRIKEKFASLFDKQDTNEGLDNEPDEIPEEKGADKKDGASFRDSLKSDVSLSDQAQTAREYREAHNIDEHGNKLDNSANDSAFDTDPASEAHGENGERTRWSDAEYARNHER